MNKELGYNVVTKYGKFLLGQDLISNEIKNGVFHEPELFAIFEKYLTKGSVVIEVGSYYGDHTVYMSKLVGDTGKIYAFEPFPDTFSKLCHHLDINECKNVVPVKAVISSREAYYRLVTRGDPFAVDFLSNPDGARFVENEGHFPNPVVQKSYSLDTLFLGRHLQKRTLSRLDLLKVDAEGMDFEVLFGAMNLIFVFYPLIVFEYNANISTKPFKNYQKLLSLFGYKITQISKWNYLAEVK